MRLIKTIDDINVANRKVLVRSDLNVPMQNGKISDTARILRSIPTINALASKGARVIIISHLGRPGGKRTPELSLKPVAEALEIIINRRVVFGKDCIGPDAQKAIDTALTDEVVLLENLRFYNAEEDNDESFADQLAALADIYINDAFSCAHRAHASTEAISRRLPSAAGILMQAELDALSSSLELPAHPLAAIVGGAKISTKMAVLGYLVERVDQLIIGGGMANTFLFAGGYDIGNSLCEVNMADQACKILEKAISEKCEVVLPSDAIVANDFVKGATTKHVSINAIPKTSMILDIGPASIHNLKQRLAVCKTVVWNGPLGAFETEPFDLGTNEVAAEVALLTKAGKLLSVAGGGDTISALKNARVIDDFSYVSAAGGAFLEWLEGRTLPGVAALLQNQ
ncbi:MAG: phosphoglycerate kinase [Magnetovibrio sp.]|nr:phosphoglycerate kinase [Magnetovibrio sp.]